MLLNIYIKNFGIIDQLRFDLQAGFNVLTGETGAGKSVIIGPDPYRFRKGPAPGSL